MKTFTIIASAFCVGWVILTSAVGSNRQIISISISNNHVGLTFQTTNGCLYQVQANTTLTNRYWSEPLPILGATGNLSNVTISASGMQGYFRVAEYTNSVFWYDWNNYYQSSYLNTWGLGATQNTYVHSDRSYEWYIDQADTGTYAGNNCGPSSVTMGIKWYQPAFNKTAVDARNTYLEGGGWWYTSDIINYLNLYSIPHTTSTFTGTNQLMNLVGQTNLVILCIDTSYLTQDATSEHRVKRFYSYAGGHFLVVKGYRIVDNQLFFEVYDPNNWHAVYADATPKGRNRHLPAGDLASAINNWWSYLIVIPPPNGVQSNARTNWLKPVDPKRIKHMWGK